MNSTMKEKRSCGGENHFRDAKKVCFDDDTHIIGEEKFSRDDVGLIRGGEEDLRVVVMISPNEAEQTPHVAESFGDTPQKDQHVDASVPQPLEGMIPNHNITKSNTKNFLTNKLL